MWTRVQLKDKAKAALKMNYWKMVLVAVLMTLLVGGATGSTYTFDDTDSVESDNDLGYGEDLGYGDDFEYDGDEYIPSWDELESELGSEFADDFGKVPEAGSDFLLIVLIILLAVLIGLAVGLAIGFVFTSFVSNPMEVGCSRFFVKTLEEPAQIREVAHAFDNSYMNVVKVMFFRTLYTTLWTMLFIVPGIVKSYEYRMIPYLLAENPNLTKEQAFALSKQMMMGQKWSAFILDMSFIGWHILSVCTIGVLEIFYVAPYVYATNAALYEELSSIYGRPAKNAYVTAPYEPVSAYQSVNPYENNNSYETYYTAPVQEETEQDAKNEE